MSRGEAAKPGARAPRPVDGAVTSAPAIVSVQDLEKSFGATRAVRGVSLDIPAGSIFGLVGENGAGKSTLGKLIAGVETPDGGSLRIGGREVTLRSPHEGIRAGVSMMAQEIMLAPDRTVEENVLLGNLPRRGPFPDRRAMRRRFRELVELTGFELNPGAKAGSLRIADQQKVEILRSVSQDAELIVMDEPSAALTTDEVERLHHTIRAIAARGSAVLLISHFLEEILALADRVAIMRDGELVRVGPAGDETVDTLVAGMVGRALNTEYRTDKPQARGPARLQVSNLSRRGVLDGISFTVREGEILGFAGLVGSGRTEIARCVFGADRFDRGEILLDGRPLTANSPSGAIKAGVFMIPEDRKELGLLLEGSVADNLLLATLDRRSRRGWVTRAAQRPPARRLAESVDLRYTRLDQPAGSLSGGNQQKLLFGRAKDVAPRVLIVDEPTRGVDIAAKRAIHATLEAMAEQGTVRPTRTTIRSPSRPSPPRSSVA